ncbi:MAG: hypothetical protein ACKVU1_10930 [bacterium]
MGPATIIIGFLLAFIGMKGCFSPEPSKVSALTPAFIGLPLLVLGVVALNSKLRMHAMHVAAMLGLVGVVLGAKGVFLWLGGGQISSQAAVTQSLMLFLSAGFLALCINSFVSARKKREAEKRKAAAPPTSSMTN